MASYRISRSAPWIAPHHLGAIATALGPLGYTLSSAALTSVALKFSGILHTMNDAQAPHTLGVALILGGIQFDFHCPGALVYFTDREKAFFEDRASRAIYFASHAYHPVQQQVAVQVNPPPPQYHPPQPPAPYVIERQVIVVRCRYCQRITAIDLAGCSHCGASKFS